MREFKVIGPYGQASRCRNQRDLCLLTTDVTELYDSQVSLIATRQIGTVEDIDVVREQNMGDFVDIRLWKVSQYKVQPVKDATGITSFKMVPMIIFNELWRKPVSVPEQQLRSKLISGSFTLDGKYGQWEREDGFQLVMTRPERSMVWLYKYNPLVYIFTDETRMFVDPQDELAYIADVLS